MTIAVDFDGTIVTHNYPAIGEEIPFAIDTLKMLRQDGHLLILWSVREGQLLDEAIEWCRQRGLEFYAVNRDYPEETTDNNPQFSRKLKVDVFIDDRNLGGLPDWGTIYRMIKQRHTWHDVIDDLLSQSSISHTLPPPQKTLVAILAKKYLVAPLKTQLKFLLQIFVLILRNEVTTK